jgi:hypothetical protein
LNGSHQAVRFLQTHTHIRQCQTSVREPNSCTVFQR